MKRITHGGAALAFVVGTALASTPAAVAAAEQHFALFSNKSDIIMTACYTSRDKNGKELAHDCDQVRLNSQSTFFVPREAADTRVTVSDQWGQLWGSNLPNNRDLCLRATRTGKVHEATEQPCTPD
ncbi:hypothetical protein JNUCC0626_47930 [Lentzea sp. JNUCC 0626]|uniref:hypothetical protein n=1 Tax=Lentzea sp. JNUCC 0626 TaxID=3367513 RepID=UPI003748FEEB